MKAVGPDDAPLEVWKHQGNVAIKHWTRLVKTMLDKAWRMKEKSAAPDLHESGRCAQMWQLQRINLVSHTMKL